MKKTEKKIVEILQKNNILQEFVDDIVIKNDNIIMALDAACVHFNKDEGEKIIAKIKEEIKQETQMQKVSIVLTAQKNKTPNIAKSVKKAGFFGIFGKKNQENDDLAKKTTENVKNLPENTGKAAHIEGVSKSEAKIQPVKGVKKIIAVASAKGGVGKSTFAVNLAASLKRIGYKVAVVDADIYGPSIPHLMNLRGQPEARDNLLLPIISHNIKCISIGSLIDKNAAGVWRGPMITKILYQLIRSVNWNYDNFDVDYMIIDMPPGTGDVYLSLAQNFPLAGVVMVSTPQSLAVIDAVRSVDCFKKLNIPILGVVQNMAYLLQNGEKNYIFGRDNAKKMAQDRQIKFLGDVPLKQEISDSSENKIPFVIANSSSPEAILFGRIAEKIIEDI